MFQLLNEPFTLCTINTPIKSGEAGIKKKNRRKLNKKYTHFCLENTERKKIKNQIHDANEN